MNGYFLRLEALFRVFDNHLWNLFRYYTRYALTPDYQYGIYGVLAIPVFFLINLSVASTGEAFSCWHWSAQPTSGREACLFTFFGPVSLISTPKYRPNPKTLFNSRFYGYVLKQKNKEGGMMSANDFFSWRSPWTAICKLSDVPIQAECETRGIGREEFIGWA
jgi:hypothetical protein